ncbi:hypothetical protein Tco_0546387 [Tanacetum coccineum]
MCHIVGIEPQFINIILNGPYVPMIARVRKHEAQWTNNERKVANLDQRLKSLIMSVLPDDQINSVINCETAKSTWEDLLLYHEGPFDVKENRVIDVKLCYSTFKFKEGENLTQTFSRYKALINELVNDGIKLLKLEINIGFNKVSEMLTMLRIMSLLLYLANSSMKKTSLTDFQDNPNDKKDTRSSQEYMNDLEMEFHERALLAKSKRFFIKGTQRSKGTHATCNDESGVVGKESAKNGEWVKISMRKVHTLLEMEDNGERKSFFDYLGVDLNFVEEQRNNLVIKHRDIVQELNTCKEKLLELKHVKLDFLKMQLNLCINEQIPNQKKRILEVDQLTKDPYSSGQKDLVFIKSSANDTKVSIPNVERPWLSEAEGFNVPNHDIGIILLSESHVHINNPSATMNVTNSSVNDYNSDEESSSVCITTLPLLEKLVGVTINEPTNLSAPAKGNKIVLASRKNSALAGKLKNVKTKYDIPLSVVMTELNYQKLQIGKNQPSYSRNKKPQQVPKSSLQTQFKNGCELYEMNNPHFENCYKVLFCKKCEGTDHRTCDHAKYMNSMNMSQHLKSQGIPSSRSLSHPA